MFATQSKQHEAHAEDDVKPFSRNHLGPYSIKGLIGSGGTGFVYRAHDLGLNREVAIRICRAGFSPHLDHTANVIASLHHPNICTLFELGPNYVVMEFVDGKTLAHWIAAGAMSAVDAVNVAIQITRALIVAHRAGVNHHDLSATNIKVRNDGLLKILDLGVSQQTNRANDTSGPGMSRRVNASRTARSGTVGDQSPNQPRWAVDHRTDLRSVGILLYQMLTQRLPFSDSVDAESLMGQFEPVDAIIGISPELQRVIDRCLEQDGKIRYSSAEMLGADLSCCAANLARAG